MFNGDRASVWEGWKVLEKVVVTAVPQRECASCLSRALETGRWCIASRLRTMNDVTTCTEGEGDGQGRLPSSKATPRGSAEMLTPSPALLTTQGLRGQGSLQLQRGSRWGLCARSAWPAISGGAPPLRGSGPDRPALTSVGHIPAALRPGLPACVCNHTCERRTLVSWRCHTSPRAGRLGMPGVSSLRSGANARTEVSRGRAPSAGSGEGPSCLIQLLRLQATGSRLAP